jgi:hypothetical protein
MASTKPTVFALAHELLVQRIAEAGRPDGADVRET